MRLRHANEGPQRCDVLSGVEASLRQPLSQATRDCSRELVFSQFGDISHLYRSKCELYNACSRLVAHPAPMIRESVRATEVRANSPFRGNGTALSASETGKGRPVGRGGLRAAPGVSRGARGRVEDGRSRLAVEARGRPPPGARRHPRRDRGRARFASHPLVRQPRLSMMPGAKQEFERIEALARRGAAD
jgi:hypothetical protein